MKKCPRCHKIMMDSLRKATNNNPNVHPHEGEFVYPCKLPNYTYDNSGRPIVIIWDCEKNRQVTMHHEEYMKKKREEDL